MAFQPVPDVAEFRMVQGLSNPVMAPVEILNTLYLARYGLGWTDVQLQAAANGVRDAWNARVRPLISNIIRFREVQARDLSNEFGAQAVSVAGTDGGAAGDCDTTIMCFGVALQGAPGLPPRKGRLFIAGVPNTAVASNVLGTGSRDAMTAAILGLLGDLETGDQQPVIVSRYSKQFVTPTNKRGLRPVAASNGIIGAVCRDIVWSQRDRRPGHLG